MDKGSGLTTLRELQAFTAACNLACQGTDVEEMEKQRDALLKAWAGSEILTWPERTRNKG